MEGTPYKIGSREFIVPRLRVLAWERAVEASKAIGDESDPVKRNDLVLSIVAELLRPNYREITVADIKAELYLDEVADLIGGVCAAGGRRPPKSGETASP